MVVTFKRKRVVSLDGISNETSNESDVKEAYAQMMAEWVVEAITSATVTVPGTGLVAPPSGGPVTGISNTGALS